MSLRRRLGWGGCPRPRGLCASARSQQTACHQLRALSSGTGAPEARPRRRALPRFLVPAALASPLPFLQATTGIGARPGSEVVEWRDELELESTVAQLLVRNGRLVRTRPGGRAPERSRVASPKWRRLSAGACRLLVETRTSLFQVADKFRSSSKQNSVSETRLAPCPARGFIHLAIQHLTIDFERRSLVRLFLACSMQLFQDLEPAS